jgi:hypothetical protein
MKGKRSEAAGGAEGAPSEPAGRGRREALAHDDGAAPRAPPSPEHADGAPPAPGAAKRKRAAKGDAKQADAGADERAGAPGARAGGSDDDASGGGSAPKELPPSVVEEGRLYMLYRRVPAGGLQGWP